MTAVSLKTKSQDAAADVAALLRARNPLIWVVTREEARVERYLFEAAASAGYLPRTWDVAQGVASAAGKPEKFGERGPDELRDPGATLALVRERAEATKPERGLWVMRDVPAWIVGPGGATTLRQVRNLARLLPGTPRETAQSMIFITPSGDVPPELANHATVVEWPLPDRAEIAGILDAAIAGLPEEMRSAAAPNGTRDAAVDAAVGLTGEEAASCYARSLVQHRRVDPAAVAAEKKRVVAREGLLEWIDPLPGGLDSVGGLDVLKKWLAVRATAYGPAARAYGLPAPRGVFLAGVSGCGKSMTAKAAAATWACPLLKMDLGALKSKFVGDSEARLRKALKIIESVGRCVVWLDEVEKALQGATSGSADGGVSADALGAILTWMQERAGEAFVIATANDISGLPPEFLRKGRFDEVFFVDLPNPTERADVMTSALRAHGRGEAVVDAASVSAATAGFTGSEIAAIVPDALFVAFADGARQITTLDLVRAAGDVVPLSRTAAEKIGTLRKWADERARRATSPAATDAAAARSEGRALDI